MHFLGRLPWEHTVIPRDSWRAGEGSASADQPGQDLPTIKADKLVSPNWLFLQAPVSAFTQSNLKSLSLAKTLLPPSLGFQQEPPHLRSLPTSVRGSGLPLLQALGLLVSPLTHSVPLRKSQSLCHLFFLISCLLINCCLSGRRTKPFPQGLCRAVR